MTVPAQRRPFNAILFQTLMGQLDLLCRIIDAMAYLVSRLPTPFPPQYPSSTVDVWITWSTLAWASLIHAAHFELRRRRVCFTPDGETLQAAGTGLDQCLQQVTGVAVVAAIKAGHCFWDVSSLTTTEAPKLLDLAFLTSLHWVAFDSFASSLLEEEEVVSLLGVGFQAESALRV